MKKFLSGRQTFFVCIACILGPGIFSSANICTKYLSTSMWIAPLLCSLVFFVPAFLLCRLSRSHQCSIYEYTKNLFGRFSPVLSLPFSVFYLIFSALLLSYYSHIISMWILPDTDYRLICAFICIICFYALTSSFTNTSRLITITVFLSSIAVITVRISMIMSGDIANLLPIYDNETVSNGFAAAFSGLFPFFFGTGILAIMPCSKKSFPSADSSFAAIITSGLILILVSYACMSTIGPLQTGMYEDAMILAMKAFDISQITFIQRADIIFIVTWSFLILSSISLVVFIPHAHIVKVFDKKHHTLARLFLCILIFLIAVIFGDMDSALYAVSRLCLTYGVFVLFIIPAILLIFTEVRRYEKK